METTAYDEGLVARLQESLRLTRLELAALREEQEGWAEERVRLERAQDALHALSGGLDERLTAAESVRGPRGWVRRRLLRTLPTPAESAELARLRDTGRVDGAWYLREYPEVAASGLSPALHYLRHGAAEGKAPGPDSAAQR